jgi:hypothetical protein
MTNAPNQYVGRAGNFANNWDPNVTIPGAPENVTTGVMQVCRESCLLILKVLKHYSNV